ncbi:uncharacterized protein SEPMUDRAFT_125976 [Sphaerulina musiva SO2202]|uniref:Uncharacterized protein n=1 Tax=Sphaerulina musiva (strain SO2202) TaxID=692275 RepID=M3D3Y7_SPHMS|nr:uncharacterized protein SEPMUDRAFT_125976 [Sphaerulina musiva SO2202]EMF12900.1 hypothetical protein SEPMUDRAFT_125976 [Sphaerulina musiva SO2202]
MREKRESKRAGEVQSRDDDALSSPSQQGNACMHSVATGKRYLPSMRGAADARLLVQPRALSERMRAPSPI